MHTFSYVRSCCKNVVSLSLTLRTNSPDENEDTYISTFFVIVSIIINILIAIIYYYYYCYYYYIRSQLGSISRSLHFVVQSYSNSLFGFYVYCALVLCGLLLGILLDTKKFKCGGHAGDRVQIHTARDLQTTRRRGLGSHRFCDKRHASETCVSRAGRGPDVAQTLTRNHTSEKVAECLCHHRQGPPVRHPTNLRRAA